MRIITVILHLPFMILGFIWGFVHLGFLGGWQAYDDFREWGIKK